MTYVWRDPANKETFAGSKEVVASVVVSSGALRRPAVASLSVHACYNLSREVN